MITSLLFWVAIGGAFCLGYVVGRMDQPRAPRQYPLPEFRRVARPCTVARAGDEYIAIAADYLAWREDFTPADQRLLDELTGVRDLRTW